MALNAYARAVTDRLVAPVARGLVRLGATANALTVAGFVGTLAALAVVLTVSPRWGAVALAAASLVDAVDGAVARQRGTVSQFGAFLDSVTDRLSDAAIFATLAWLVRDDPVLFSVAMVALGGAQVTSYIRAKAESLGWSASVGVLERAERVIIVTVALVTDLVPVALWVLAAGVLFTVGQRMRAVMQQAHASGRGPSS